MFAHALFISLYTLAHTPTPTHIYSLKGNGPEMKVRIAEALIQQLLMMMCGQVDCWGGPCILQSFLNDILKALTENRMTGHGRSLAGLRHIFSTRWQNLAPS